MQWLAQNGTIEEEQCAQRLILGRRADLPAVGKIGQEGGDVLATEFGGVAFAVVEDEPARPMRVGIFGSAAEMPKPARLPDLVEQFR